MRKLFKTTFDDDSLPAFYAITEDIGQAYRILNGFCVERDITSPYKDFEFISEELK